MFIFARAIRHLEIDREERFADIVHNPYRKGFAAQQLFRELHAERLRMISGSDGEERAAGPGISMAQLEQAFGPVKMQYVTREQIEEMRKPRGSQ